MIAVHAVPNVAAATCILINTRKHVVYVGRAAHKNTCTHTYTQKHVRNLSNIWLAKGYVNTHTQTHTLACQNNHHVNVSPSELGEMSAHSYAWAQTHTHTHTHTHTFRAIHSCKGVAVLADESGCQWWDNGLWATTISRLLVCGHHKPALIAPPQAHSLTASPHIWLHTAIVTQKQIHLYISIYNIFTPFGGCFYPKTSTSRA